MSENDYLEMIRFAEGLPKRVVSVKVEVPIHALGELMERIVEEVENVYVPRHGEPEIHITDMRVRYDDENRGSVVVTATAKINRFVFGPDIENSDTIDMAGLKWIECPFPIWNGENNYK